MLGNVLYLAAHPDDENTRFISYCANEKLFNTGYLSLTRGSGGQNLIGTEIREELGLLELKNYFLQEKLMEENNFFLELMTLDILKLLTKLLKFGISKRYFMMLFG